ncbi:MAG: Hpt domain-containing protein [Balneolaceae bacterium]|nr:MAG: Hpt domain-containing protein [Balneolaceae bacterium]
MSENESLNQFKGLAVWDDKGMMERMLGDSDLAKLIIEQFLIDAPTQIDALSELIEKGDLAMIKQRVHAVKGASANVGGEAFRKVACAVEELAQNQDLEQIKILYPLLLKNFKDLQERLNNYLKNQN